MTKLEQMATWASVRYGPLTRNQKHVLTSLVFDQPIHLTHGRRARTVRSLQRRKLLDAGGQPTLAGRYYAGRTR